MAVLIYDGSAKDHKVTPQILKRGENGKPVKRKVVKPEEYTFTPVDTYELWGMKFPKDTEVEVPREMISRGLIKKARALKCFKILEVPVEVRVEGDDAPKAKRGKFGRPLQVAE